MFRRSFVREPCRVASCPAEHRGVTFAGCDVENWIQVWDGVYRRRGKSQGSREKGRNEGGAREKEEREKRQKSEEERRLLRKRMREG